MKSLIFIWILLLGILIFPLFWCFWRYFLIEFERKPLQPQSVWYFTEVIFPRERLFEASFCLFWVFLVSLVLKPYFQTPFYWISNPFWWSISWPNIKSLTTDFGLTIMLEDMDSCLTFLWFSKAFLNYFFQCH